MPFNPPDEMRIRYTKELGDQCKLHSSSVCAHACAHTNGESDVCLHLMSVRDKESEKARRIQRDKTLDRKHREVK